MKRIIFEKTAFNDFNNWAKQDKKIYKKICDLIKDIERTLFTGLGKPEALKHELSGYWSRRVDNKHRLVYKIEKNELIVISCKFHC